MSAEATQVLKFLMKNSTNLRPQRYFRYSLVKNVIDFAIPGGKKAEKRRKKAEKKPLIIFLVIHSLRLW